MNIAIINQGGSRYLFGVPENISLKEGERVKCDTRHGVTDGIVWADSLHTDEPTAKLIGRLTGARFPLRSVTGRMEYAPFERVGNKPAEDKQEPVKLYCFKSQRNILTAGKIYSVPADGKLVFDNGQISCYDWKTEIPSTWPDYLCKLVKRPAKIGEWVYPTQSNVNIYSQGEIACVMCTAGDNTVKMTGNQTYPTGRWIHENHYLVLDGYHPEPEPEAEKEPEYWNGEVICIDNDGDYSLTVGMKHAVIDGHMCWNDGEPMRKRFKSFEMINEYFARPECVTHAKFIEFKGEQ